MSRTLYILNHILKYCNYILMYLSIFFYDLYINI
nr:MAG TPA_asm: hypothetical protein [Caudoviricetes sp.]